MPSPTPATGVDCPAAGAPWPGGPDLTLPPELQKAMGGLLEISSLPEITTRIVEVVEDPKSTAQDMRDIVKNDPALAAKILKVVNSAFYGLPSQISSLDRAIVMLGLSAVKNIALAASLARLFRPGAISAKFSARDLWLHSVAVGTCARLLAHAGRGATEEAFVAGLVHDMGLLVEYQIVPDKLHAVVTRCENADEDFMGVEREIIGADHRAFGGALAARWKFPPGLRHAIVYHHDPAPLKPEFQRAVGTVYAADTLCCQSQIGFWLTARGQQISSDLLDQIHVTPDQVQQVLEVLPERIAETQQIFTE